MPLRENVLLDDLKVGVEGLDPLSEILPKLLDSGIASPTSDPVLDE